VESPGRKELAQDQWLEHDLVAKVVSTFADHALARVPTRWNHLVEKNSRKFNSLSMILSQKWFPLLRIMLQLSAVLRQAPITRSGGACAG
jgi:hypothetical protein